jgi:hypothetical protein
MPTVNISPVWNGTQFLTTEGYPLAGGKIYTYEAGSFDTLKTTYTDNTGTSENTNPIILDSSGRMPTGIWLIPGEFYNLVLKSPYDVLINNVDYVNVGQIIAGDNISIDPANGIGAVTITGVWPKYIVSTFGHGRSYMFWLESSSTHRMRFNGTAYNDWTGTQKSPTTVESTQDVTWDAENQQFVFNTAGSYTIVITAKIDPRVGESIYWPRYATAYGAIISGVGSSDIKSYRTRYTQTSGGGLGSENQQTTWTDEFTVSVQANDAVTLSTYALSPNYSSSQANTDATVIITRFGDAYPISS